MIFLYIILGMFMFTNIISIFEMSTAINNQKIFDRPSQDSGNLLISKREKDRRFLKLLSEVHHTLGSSTSLCNNIIDGISNDESNNYSILSKYSDLENYRQGIPITSQHSSFINGCNLNSGNHRVIIVPSQNNQTNYLFYSCLSNGLICKFEED